MKSFAVDDNSRKNTIFDQNETNFAHKKDKNQTIQIVIIGEERKLPYET